MRRLVSMAVLLLMLAGISASASTAVAMSQRDLTQASEAVIQGQVLKIHSFWDPSGRTIVTEALVKVEEVVVGKSPTVVVVRTFGGTVDGFTVEAPGFPTFRRSERVLLFLEPEKEGVSLVAGDQLGHYKLVKRDGREIAVPALDLGTRLLRKDGRSMARPQPVALETLKDRIRTEAARLGRD